MWPYSEWGGYILLVGIKFIIDQVKDTYKQLDCSGGGLMILQDDKLIIEEYWGEQSFKSNAEPIDANTLFHLASVRKTYIAFAATYAVHYGYIQSIDDLIEKYLQYNHSNFQQVTIRHLLTHTHGLRQINQEIKKEFSPGKNWAYRGIGVDLLVEIIEQATDRSIADILHKEVFNPLGFQETDWYGTLSEQHVEVIHQNNPSWYESTVVDGSKMNMYASVRELVKWGQLHLHKGQVEGKQVIPSQLFEMSTVIQSPKGLSEKAAKNGFFWFIQDKPGISNSTELGGILPQGSYQILGYTSVILLVIPRYNIIAVRAFNSFGSSKGFDYLEDVQAFGNTIINAMKYKLS